MRMPYSDKTFSMGYVPRAVQCNQYQSSSDTCYTLQLNGSQNDVNTGKLVCTSQRQGLLGAWLRELFTI